LTSPTPSGMTCDNLFPVVLGARVGPGESRWTIRPWVGRLHVVPTFRARCVRDLAWTLAGVSGAFVAIRAMEVLRPEVIADDFSAPENEIGIGELPRAYTLSTCSMLASPLITAARLPSVCGPLGIGVELTAVGLRAWAMRTLRGQYAHALRVVEDQPVIQSGPYSIVRHPGYLSALFVWLGAALSSRNTVPVALTVLAVGTAYQHRMDAEDTLLLRELPGYADYAATTGRMVPSVRTLLRAR